MCLSVWLRVRCYGPGVEPSGPVVGAPTHFTIETFSAGKGKVEAFLRTPDGQTETVRAAYVPLVFFFVVLF